MNKLNAFQNNYEWLKVVIDSSNEAIIVLSLNGTIVNWNNGAVKIFGYAKEEIIGEPLDILVPNEWRAELKVNFNKIKNGEKIAHYESIRLHKNKKYLNISASLAPIINDEAVLGVIAIVSDITYIKNIENRILQQNEKLKESNTKLREINLRLKLIEKIFENATEGMIITDYKGNIKATNPAFIKMTGYSKDELLEKNTRLLRSDKHDENFYKNIWDSLLKKYKWSGEMWNKDKMGRLALSWVTINAVPNEITQKIMYVVVYTDLSERVKYEKELYNQAVHDSLTGLPNRLFFQKQLAKMINLAKKEKNILAVCFLDLDGFKQVNDTLGHDIGDLLLKMVAKRLKNITSRRDFVARLGGDEFTIIIYDFQEEKNIIKIAKRIITNIGKPYKIENNIVEITVSIGVSIYPYNAVTVKELMKQADIAMYNAKNSGKNKYILYNNADEKI